MRNTAEDARDAREAGMSNAKREDQFDISFQTGVSEHWRPIRFIEARCDNDGCPLQISNPTIVEYALMLKIFMYIHILSNTDFSFMHIDCQNRPPSI